MFGKKTITLEDGKTITIRSARDEGGMGYSKGDAPTRLAEDLAQSQVQTDKTVYLGEDPSPDQPLAWLIEKKGLRVGSTYRLNKDITSIGRDAGNDISLSDEAVSAHHAKLRIEEDKYVIYDLVSENGTEVNGEKVVYKEIKENDEIKLGETVLVFKKIS